jgi:hypothetical protein
MLVCISFFIHIAIFTRTTSIACASLCIDVPVKDLNITSVFSMEGDAFYIVLVVI